MQFQLGEQKQEKFISLDISKLNKNAKKFLISSIDPISAQNESFYSSKFAPLRTNYLPYQIFRYFKIILNRD